MQTLQNNNEGSLVETAFWASRQNHHRGTSKVQSAADVEKSKYECRWQLRDATIKPMKHTVCTFENC